MLCKLVVQYVFKSMSTDFEKLECQVHTAQGASDGKVIERRHSSIQDQLVHFCHTRLIWYKYTGVLVMITIERLDKYTLYLRLLVR